MNNPRDYKKRLNERTILVEGEPAIRPITKTFHYDKNDEAIFFESIQIIQKKIQKKMRLNINETLATYAWHVMSSLEQKRSVKEIQEIASQLFLPNQVLIEVPELLQKLTFSVTIDNLSNFSLVIHMPIPAESCFLDRVNGVTGLD